MQDQLLARAGAPRGQVQALYVGPQRLAMGLKVKSPGSSPLEHLGCGQLTFYADDASVCSFFSSLHLATMVLFFYFSFQVFVSKIQKTSRFLSVNLVYCDFAELTYLF